MAEVRRPPSILVLTILLACSPFEDLARRDADMEKMVGYANRVQLGIGDDESSTNSPARSSLVVSVMA